MRRWMWLVATAVAALVTADAGAVGFRFDDGTKFSIELVRSVGAKSRTEIGSSVMAGPDAIGYRLLTDVKAGRFFGYSVKGTPLPKGRFRVEFGRLSPEKLAALAREFEQDYGRPLTGESLAIETPVIEVNADEPVMLKLMENPATGETLSDVIRVRSEPKTPPDNLAIQDARMRVDGVVLPGSGGASGKFVYFSAEKHGLFVFSRVEGGQALQPVTIADGGKTLIVSSAGHTYEWVLGRPVDLGSGKRLFVRVDPSFVGAGTFGVGTLSSLDETPPRR